MKRSHLPAATLAAALATLPAQAQFAVIDVAAVNQLVQQMNAWAEQLQSMRLQLEQLQATRAALTGNRGMAMLYPQSPAARNYLPVDVASVMASPLGSDIAARMAANAVLAPADLARLAPADVAQLVAWRQSLATRTSLMAATVARSSQRFAELSQLIDRIATAGDAKAIADLEGRIAAEQAMLANDQTKMAAFEHYSEADRTVRELAVREAVVKGHGNFATRFEPPFPVP